MSKLRDHMPPLDSDLPEPIKDGRHWVIYTSKRDGAPYRWAGYLDAPDRDLALQYAREHYGLDEACVGIICHEHHLATDGPYGLSPLQPTSASGDDGDTWTVFTLLRRGGIHQTAGTVQAPDANKAINRATASFADGRIHSIRVVRSSDIFTTTKEELIIWRTHDMTYKLAKGYSKLVREKWTQFRDEKTYEQYRKEDIANHF